MSAPPVPDRHDPEFAPFWDGTDRHEVLVQRCPSCAELRWPPRPMCARCHTVGVEWAPVAPRGTLFSWVDVRHRTMASAPPPYLLGMVELADAGGIRMLGRLVGVTEETCAIGMEMVGVFEESDAGVTLVNWTPA